MNDHRIESGVPQGGQFAAHPHAESPVKLFDRNDGSFFKPSPSRSADHCIGFWSSIAIPDEIIRQVENVYFQTRTKEVETGVKQRVADWKAGWLQENPKPRFKVDEWEARLRDEQAAFAARATEDLTGARPMRLGEYDSRQLIRAAQMYCHLPNPNRFREENLKVRDHEIELYDETLTVEQIQDKYKLYQIHYSMEAIFEDTTEKQILESINTLNENLSIISEDVIDARTESVL